MRYNDKTVKDCKWLDLAAMKNSVILITGGTGLIGYNIIKELCIVSDELNIKILALVRDIERATEKFKELGDKVEMICGNILDFPEIEGNVDYIIHGASLTSSKAFVENPVETILTSFLGTKNMLDLAVQKKVRSFVYLSSMEVYGSPQEEMLLSEDKVGYLDPLKLRSSYPESKRMCENLCISYKSEYGVQVKIARLAQTFGPGISKDDERVFVQFIRKALDKENIEIKTSGKSSRMYVYTFDAVTAILTVLLSGGGWQRL